MKYLGEVLWGSLSGNPCCTKRTVDADTAGAAYKLVADKVKLFARFKKLHGGNARAIKTKRGNGSHDTQ